MRGEVIIFNVETGVSQLISLDGVESHWAMPSLDGRYIVTIDPTFSYFRKYEISTGNLVIEYAIHIQGDRVQNIVELPDGNFGIRLSNIDGASYFQLITLSR